LSGEELSCDDIAKLESSLKSYTGSTIKLTHKKSDLDGIKVTVDDLGIEVNFSKERVKEQLIDFITRDLYSNLNRRSCSGKQITSRWRI